MVARGSAEKHATTWRPDALLIWSKDRDPHTEQPQDSEKHHEPWPTTVYRAAQDYQDRTRTLVDVERGAKQNCLAVKGGFPTKPQQAKM